VVALSYHYIGTFEFNWVTHLGPIYVATLPEAEARRTEAAARFLGLQAEVIAETDKALARYRSVRTELTVADAAFASLTSLTAPGHKHNVPPPP
jgi:hypothetical protein